MADSYPVGAPPDAMRRSILRVSGSGGTAPAQPVDGLPGDPGRDGVPSGELPVRDVVTVRLESRDDAPAGPPDRQDVVGVAVGDEDVGGPGPVGGRHETRGERHDPAE